VNPDKRIISGDDDRHHVNAAKGNYRTPAERDQELADQAAEWLTDWATVPIGKTTHTERQAAANRFTPGSHRAYVGVLHTLDRAADAADVRLWRREPRQRDRESSRTYTAYADTPRRNRCQNPVTPVLEDDAGTRRVVLAPCETRCRPCREWWAIVTARRATDWLGASGYAYLIADADAAAFVKRCQRAGVPFHTVPIPNGRQIVTAAPVGDQLAVAVEVADAVRDAAATNPHDGRRVSLSGQRHPDPSQRPPPLAEVSDAMMGREPDEDTSAVVGFWQPRLVAETVTAETVTDQLAAAAAAVGCTVEPNPAGVTIPAGDDRARQAFLRRIGFTPLAKVRGLSRSSGTLPVAEAYELWKRWQESNEPPAELYDQLALEVAS